MRRTGAQYLESLRDGRAIFIDGERVDDVTTHPAFAGAARSIARLYDFSSDPANEELMTYETEDGDRAHVMYMIPRTQDDLRRRREGLRAWAELTFGLMGRSPDHVAAFLAGFAGSKRLFGDADPRFEANVERFYKFARNSDLYCSYVIVPPQIDRSKAAHDQADPHLYAGVKEERPDGIVVAGAQMLGTGAVMSDYVMLSCIIPLQPGDENQAITVMIPMNAPGVQMYSRRSYAAGASSVFDYPLSSQFDENDALAVFDDVFVPWENVFAYKDIRTVNAQWWDTPAHILGNNQAQIRFSVKLELLTGLAYRVAESTGSINLPPVRAAVAEVASRAAMVNGLVLGAERACALDSDGVMRPGNEETYSAITMQSQMYPAVLTMVRELCGGGVIQLPASVEDLRSPETAEVLNRYMVSGSGAAEDRVKLLKLVWDLIGSEFGSRHLQYEMFYAGAPFIVKQRMYRNYDFARASSLVDKVMATYDMNGVLTTEAQSATVI